jgi:hypothetical protein
MICDGMIDIPCINITVFELIIHFRVTTNTCQGGMCKGQ